jgi:UDP-N-acetylmuramyl tripeptide synthase
MLLLKIREQVNKHIMINKDNFSILPIFPSTVCAANISDDLSGLEKIKDFDYEIILEEVQAIQTALGEATPGSLVVIFPEGVKKVLALLQSHNCP